MRWGLAIALALACQGCGLAFYSGPGLLDVEVADAPPGTRVVLQGLDNDLVRELPTHARQIALPRGSSYAIGITAPGHKPALELIRVLPTPTFFLNAAVAGVGVGTMYYALVHPISVESFVYTLLLGLGITVTGEAAYMVERLTNTDTTFDRLDVRVKLEPKH